MNEIIGRKKEQDILNKILISKEPAFLALYGRRRIGKTYLINNFFKNKGLFFRITGIQDAPIMIQLRNFAVEFSDVFQKGENIPNPKDWFEAFLLLRKELEKVPKNIKKIIFFDELPWLATPRSLFLQALDHFWNRYLSEYTNVILIVCGSAASWMIDNVITDKGGLHGRVTKEIRLLPFTLGETEEFLHHRQIHLDKKQISEIYMCLGGVAKYLSYLEKGTSAAQNIGELCFSYNGPLISEFHKLYRSLFHHYQDHVEIVTTLAKHRSGLIYKDLSQKISLSSGGTLSKRLDELIQSGFIEKIPSFKGGEHSNKYILLDEYSLFYLTWNAEASSLDLQSRGADYWIKQRNSQSWKSWTGHAFELQCLKHIEKIKAALGLAAVSTKTSKWKYIPKKSEDDSGAEIDLVIDRADQCINLCEIKYYDDEFVIDKDYAIKLRKKKEIFERITKTRKSSMITLITTYGVKQNSYYHEIVDNTVTIDKLFS